jgi:hypothetical protein
VDAKFESLIEPEVYGVQYMARLTYYGPEFTVFFPSMEHPEVKEGCVNQAPVDGRHVLRSRIDVEHMCRAMEFVRRYRSDPESTAFPPLASCKP